MEVAPKFPLGVIRLTELSATLSIFLVSLTLASSPFLSLFLSLTLYGFLHLCSSSLCLDSSDPCFSLSFAHVGARFERLRRDRRSNVFLPKGWVVGGEKKGGCAGLSRSRVACIKIIERIASEGEIGRRSSRRLCSFSSICAALDLYPLVKYLFR